MDIFEVDVKNRTAVGKSAIRKLKNDGYIPGILYSGGTSTPVSLPEDQIRAIVDKNAGQIILNMHYNGRSLKAKIQEVQKNPVTNEIKHIDIMPLENDYIH